jgi:hypothetical protein
MTVYYGQKRVSQRKVHEWMENSKCEGNEMLLLMLSAFVVVVVVVAAAAICNVL